MDPMFWTVNEVGNFLDRNNFKQYRSLFCDENKIDGKTLLSLREDDMKVPPMNISVLGDIKRLWVLIEDLQTENRLSDQRKIIPIETHLNMFSPMNKYIVIDQMSSSSESSLGSGQSYTDSDDSLLPVKRLKVEPKKFILSILYLAAAHFFTSYAIVFAQERLPDKKKYPPLPDIFLDYLPQIPWAYRITEASIGVLSICGIVLLLFHKHRFFLMQRFMVFLGTVYILRSCCVMSTSIPMPQNNYDCERLELNSCWERFTYAVHVYIRFGMKSTNLNTCGDYVYSGHTSMITALVLGINENTPRRMTYLHTFNWIVGFFGTFFILLSHGHYTLDIFLAFVITTKLFHVHQSFANNLSLMARDRFRLKTCFPLIYYFERDIAGPVPREYECPLPRFKKIQTFCNDLKCSVGKVRKFRPKYNI